MHEHSGQSCAALGTSTIKASASLHCRPENHAATVWLTGLSGAGKSMLAKALGAQLAQSSNAFLMLDGDIVRHGLSNDLGFSAQDRSENIRRVAEVAKLANASGVLVIAALISPLETDRSQARRIIGSDHFVEVHMSTRLAVCASRDPKGLYAKARSGVLTEFTGVSSPYEAPRHPQLCLDSEFHDVAHNVQHLYAYLKAHGFIEHRAAQASALQG